MDKLRFIITKDSFRVDDVVYAENDMQHYADDFAKAPYDTLYELAFHQRPECFDTAGNYLCRLAENFVEELTAVTGLELSREKTELTPSEESIELLLNSVPFMLGAEFVTRTWIKRQYRRLMAVFAKQIKTYAGKVSLYFAEKAKSSAFPNASFSIWWKATRESSRSRFWQPTRRRARADAYAMFLYNMR